MLHYVHQLVAIYVLLFGVEKVSKQWAETHYEVKQKWAEDLGENSL